MTKPCGSEPAREGRVSDDITVEWHSAIASKLAPTGYSPLPTNPATISSITAWTLAGSQDS